MSSVMNAVIEAALEGKREKKVKGESEYDAAVKRQYNLILLRTGEEPELPSAMEKRMGVDAAKKEILALKAELEGLRVC